MVDICETIRTLLKYKKTTIDNNIFRLHYKFTVILLLIFSFMVTSKQYFGDPIDCDSGSLVDKYYMDTYCWIYSTFTIKRHLKGVQGVHFAAPGVGASRAVRISDTSDEIIKHKYYQWVCIVLFIQAIFFYIPRHVWKIWEAGRMGMLVKDFGTPLVSSSWNDNAKDKLIKYLLHNRYAHNLYAIRYAICEVCNLVNVVAQIFIMDWFLSGQFTGFGIAVLTFHNAPNESNPMTQVFPKLTKCTYENFGPSGSIQLVDALCVLPLNVVNEKLYVLLWFWFFFLTIISFIALLYRAIVMSSKTVRSYLLMAQVRLLRKRNADIVVNKLSFGDWFIIYQIGKNMNPIIFEELVTGLEHKLDPRSKMNHIFGSKV